MKAKNVEELFGTLQQSIVEEWRKHLKTSKYSKHMALDEFYKDMPELVDALIEGYNGHAQTKVTDFKNVLDAEKLDALQYLEELHELCQSGYDLMPEDAPEVKANLDAVKDKIDAVMYKVRELKESFHMKPLAQFVRESINEGFKADERVMIDNLTNSQWKKFAKAIEKNLNSDLDEADILMAMKALAGMNYQVAVSDFHMLDKNNTTWLALNAYDTTMVFDVDANEWIDEKDA